AAEQPSVAERVASVRDLLARRLKATVSDLVVNAEESVRAPHLLSVAIPGADSEALLMHFDLAGVAVSSGSACSTGAVEPSHVLVAMGIPRELALGTIRFSLGRETSETDIERAVEVFPGVVEKVRKLAGVLGRSGGQSVSRSVGQAVNQVSGSNSAQRERGATSEPTAQEGTR
ncbi:MAG TPA: aminotransferase class V-fold PLP-dependent enzyme, partial [Gemmatimonadales bacterium]|nr:aminotransferase class V-fold PLP-dependent enzyme [Gemmatimonadales bacterium]